MHPCRIQSNGGERTNTDPHGSLQLAAVTYVGMGGNLVAVSVNARSSLEQKVAWLEARIPHVRRWSHRYAVFEMKCAGLVGRKTHYSTVNIPRLTVLAQKRHRMNVRKKFVRRVITLLHLIPVEVRTADFPKVMRKLHKKIGAKAAADYPFTRTRSSASRRPKKAGGRTRAARGSKTPGGQSAVGTRAPRRAAAHS